MYKTIQRLAFKSFDFSNPINEIFKEYVSRFLNQVEYAIWKQYLKANQTINSREIDYIEYYLANYMGFQSHWEPLKLDLTAHVAVELLDSRLTSKMEQFLVTPTNLEQFGKEEKAAPSVPPVVFKTYLERPKNENDFLDYMIQLQVSKALAPEDEKRPLYFYLYRLRNNLLHGIDYRIYSVKYVDKSLESLQESFEDLIVDRLLYTNVCSLSSSSIHQLYKMIEAILIDDFASDYRLGKTFEEGNRLYKEISSRIKGSLQNDNLTSSQSKILNEILLQELNETILHEWFRAYQDEFYKMAAAVVDDLSPIPESIRSLQHLFDELRKIIVATILDQGNSEKLIENAYLDVRPEDIKQKFEQMYEERLTDTTYTVAFNVKDLRADNSFTRLEIEDLEFMSEALFEGWQMGLAHQEQREKPLLFRSPTEQHDDHIWVLVHQIKAGNSDSDMATQRAKNKLLSCLGLMYYFSAREDQHHFGIEPVCYAYNHDKRIFTVLNQMMGRLEEAKSVDELDPALVEFLAQFYAEHHKWKSAVLAAANHYQMYCRSLDLSERFRQLKGMIRSLFADIREPELLAAACAVFIAGINYKGPDVTYGAMRGWLFEDFKEFLELSEYPGKEPLKERIVERFKVFCKNIFVTTLFNFDSLKGDVGEATIIDIVQWLLFMYPDSHMIREG